MLYAAMQIADIHQDDIQTLIDSYLEPAKLQRRILARSPIGKVFTQVAINGQPNNPLLQALHLPLLIYSEDFKASNASAEQHLLTQRVLQEGNLNFVDNQRLFYADAAETLAAKAQELSLSELEAIKTLKSDYAKKLQLLEELYHKKLSLEAPILVWKAIENAKNRSWKIWFCVFSFLVVGPLALVILNHKALLQFVTFLVQPGSTISLAGLAVITAPAVLYTWLLRQISKLFREALDLSTDAAHRTALTQTFLGLAENAKSGVSEVERAIILQALFRPQPSHMTDDGPPMSLGELFKSNS
jgi:Family of unknown function (DUF6161)